jgi:probable O-glycosylation ligase (exosortase A-associated)
MPLRDVILTLVIFSTVPFILREPYIGILVWSWLGFMNPHRLTWGFAYDMQFAMIIAVVTLVSLLMSKEPKKIPWTRESILLLIFIIWMVITTIFSVYPALAWPYLVQILKIQLMVFVTMMMMQSKQRIKMLVIVIALSIGFFGVKGGIFTIVHGGVYHVRGPEGSFIGGDNEMGLALCMTVPLLRYMQLTVRSQWLRSLTVVAMVLCVVAAAGSQSRGALLGLIGMGTFLWLKSRNKIFTALMGIIGALMIYTVMPDAWFERMSTIQTYQADQSAMGRINAWHMAFNLAKDRFFGAGFDSFHDEMFDRYAPDPDNVHDSHSIYFEVLGEQGFVGLALFLALGIATWFTASSIIKQGRRNPDDRWAADLAAMIQVSMVAYATAGAFLGLSYFDYYYTLIAVVVLCKVVLAADVKARAKLLRTVEVSASGSGVVARDVARLNPAPHSTRNVGERG